MNCGLFFFCLFVLCCVFLVPEADVDDGDVASEISDEDILYYYTHKRDTITLYAGAEIPIRHFHAHLTTQLQIPDDQSIKLLHTLATENNQEKRRMLLNQKIKQHFTDQQRKQEILTRLKTTTQQHLHKKQQEQHEVCCTHH